MNRAIGYVVLMLSCMCIGAVVAAVYITTQIQEANKYVVVKDLDKADIVVYNDNTDEIMFKEEAVLSFSLPPKRVRGGTYSCSNGELTNGL